MCSAAHDVVANGIRLHVGQHGASTGTRKRPGEEWIQRVLPITQPCCIEIQPRAAGGMQRIKVTAQQIVLPLAPVFNGECRCNPVGKIGGPTATLYQLPVGITHASFARDVGLADVSIAMEEGGLLAQVDLVGGLHSIPQRFTLAVHVGWQQLRILFHCQQRAPLETDVFVHVGEELRSSTHPGKFLGELRAVPEHRVPFRHIAEQVGHHRLVDIGFGRDEFRAFAGGNIIHQGH